MTNPLTFRIPRRTYLDWLRGANLIVLERAERVQLRDGVQWRQDHPEDAALLDALVGKVVRLRSSRTTNGGQKRMRGEPFLVIDTWFGRLHGIEPVVAQGKLSVPILLKPEWVSLDTKTPFMVFGRRELDGLAQNGRDGDGVAESPPGPPP